ncbi:hypothetical protein IGI04_001712 [Brassica rapa subsp. trilocularis]|uniref:RING-type E3 ubiquitin transferase n=2 Tax=Brassica campestris TaxID=3711 RepID=A0A3P5ZLI2_BRACM|nr:putative RING-H2 finger protein ATL61 [Brassica rapa]KAG5414145.1 hypothetical protein IGI04_001712 [Brassica rapa subsp. trilocularis]CAG7887836.1 unnamed protein product [Brassica rapa]VDC75323.1 unnamed protein product [Brassica rapa]
MNHNKIPLYVYYIFMLGSTQLYDGSLSGDHTDFLIGIVLVLVGFLGLLYERYFVVDDNDENDHQDHGIGTSDDHVIINIKELAGVNPSVLLRSIPVVDFNSRNARDGVKCVVCLFELADGDKAKFLPSCKHWFHARCIDPWLESHATCPICRTRVRLLQTNEPSSLISRRYSPVEPAVVTQELNYGNLTSDDEHPVDLTAVVVDIPATFEIGDLGPL